MSDVLLRVDWRAACSDPAVWRDAVARAQEAAVEFRTEHASGAHAFVDLAGAAEAIAELQAWCDIAPEHDRILLAGMGGSALSARVFDALRNDVDGPELVVLDTVDPHAIDAEMERGLDRALLVGVSKSGGTLESTAVFLTLEAWMLEQLGEAAAARVAVVSGAESNALGAYAKARGYTSFSIPAGVGGRYSALSAAGLLPAALCGASTQALCAGAAWTWDRASQDDPALNPALALAALHLAAHGDGRRPIAVLMPYGERLRALAPWWAQLVGESLGKDGRGIEPVAARGPADQHSLLQLWLDGPDTRLVVTVAADDPGPPLRVPDDGSGAFHAAGHSLGAILDAECAATGEALAARGRPVAHIGLRRADEASVGAFLMAYELSVVWIAKAMGVDPYGQPAVEAGKQAAVRRLES